MTIAQSRAAPPLNGGRVWLTIGSPSTDYPLYGLDEVTITRLRILIIGLAFACSVLSALEYSAWRRSVEQSLHSLAELGLEESSEVVFADIRRERDRRRVPLRAARALLAEELDTRRLGRAPVEERESMRARGLERLEKAQKLATSALERRPSSWQAAMILGAAKHLQLLRSRDARLVTEEESWRGPLFLAHTLAPTHPEPTRFLAGAELGQWSRLSPQRRTQAIELVEEAFADPDSFDILINPWLTVSPSFKQALSIIPSHTSSWNRVRRIYELRRDWERFITAQEQYERALLSDIGAWLDEAISWQARGRGEVAFARLKSIARNLPPDRRSVPHVDHLTDILSRTPRALHPPGNALSTWLDWFVDRCLVTNCAEAPATLPRLAALSDDLRFHQTASAALLSGDWATAKLYESRAADPLAPEWTPFHLLKARRLIAAGDLGGARHSLNRVHADRRDSPHYATGQLALARASRDLAAETLWSSRVRDLQQPIRPAREWRPSGRAWHLDVLVGRDADRIEIAIDKASPSGAPIAILVDGVVVGRESATANDLIRLRRQLPAGIHRLEVAPLLNHSVTPGPIRIGAGRPA